jgi:glycosyltransferase involved in cell wall biosynthesis
MFMVDVTGRGGAEKALVDLALQLDRTRFNVSVCATRYTGNYQPALDAAGVPTYVLGRKTRWEMHKILGLVGLLRRRRVHILHTHMFGSNSWGRVLGRLAGVPVIVAHEHWSSKPSHEIVVDRLLYRLSDRILVASKASKQVVMQLEGIPGHGITPVYNGVDTAEFALTTSEGRLEARMEIGLPPTGLLVGTLGRLSPDKGGQDDLLRAVKGLVSGGCDVRLLVVGDGPLRPRLEQLTAELGIGERVLFAGQRSGPEVPRLLGAMDIFVLPSHKEALPIALLEAMATGLPVVATRVGGVPEIVEDGENGILVPPAAPEAIEGALRTLARDTAMAERLGRAARAHIEAEFTLDRMTRRVEGIYEELARRKIGKRPTQGKQARL